MIQACLGTATSLLSQFRSPTMQGNLFGGKPVGEKPVGEKPVWITALAASDQCDVNSHPSHGWRVLDNCFRDAR